MKRKSFVAVGLLLMAAGVSFYVYYCHNSFNRTNQLSLANVEALTKEETQKGWFAFDFPCFDKWGNQLDTHKTTCTKNSGYASSCYQHNECKKHYSF